MNQIRNTAWKGGFLRYASIGFIYIFLEERYGAKSQYD